MLLLAVPLGGCVFNMLGHRGAPTPEAQSGMTRVEEPEKTPEDHLTALRERAAAAPAEPYWLYRIANLHLAKGERDSAEAALEAALARDRFYAPALSVLSEMWYTAGRHLDATRRLEPLRADFPGGMPPALLAGLALHYDALGRPDRAAQVMAEVSRPDKNDAGSAAVYVLLRGEHPESAAKPAAEAVKENPKSAAAQNNYGITLLRASDLDAAATAFRTAIELDPALPGPYYNLAILEKYYRFDDAAAARWYAQYRQRSNDDPDGLARVFAKPEKQVAGTREER
jgi:tetratricopeptide (TPR) repeat protein